MTAHVSAQTPVGHADRNGDGRFAVRSSQRRYHGIIVDVRVDDVAMPGGGTARREVVEHVRAVAVAAVDADGRVLLVEQYRHPFRRRLWELPAGLMDIPGEGPADCAARELAEETGFGADSWRVLVDIASSPGYCTEAVRVFLACDLRTVDAPARQDEEADLRVVRVPLADAVAAVLDGRIVNATAVAGLLAAARVLDVPGKADGAAGSAGSAGADRAAGAVGSAGAAGAALRSADDPWVGGPATLNVDPVVGEAPDLGSKAD